MRPEELSEHLLEWAEYGEQSCLPIGYPAYWVSFLAESVPTPLRKETHAFVLRYAGQLGSVMPASDLPKGFVKRLLTEPAVNRLLKDLGSALAQDSEVLLDREAVLLFWQDIMMDKSVATQQRLKASEQYAKALGVFVEQQHLTVEGGDKPIKVDHADLEDRLAVLRGRREAPSTWEDDEEDDLS